MRVVCAAIAHARHSVLERQPSCKHGTACAYQRALHQLLRPGQPDAAHLLLRDAAIEEALDILRVVRQAQCCGICGVCRKQQRYTLNTVEALALLEQGWWHTAKCTTSVVVALPGHPVNRCCTLC